MSLSVLLIYSSLELAYKYGNLSEGACKPGYVEAKMNAIYPKWEVLCSNFCSWFLVTRRGGLAN